MNRLLIASIDRYGPLDEAARVALNACSQSIIQIKPGGMIVAPGARTQLQLLVRGVAVRQHILADGGRQILGFATPGDFLDLSGLYGEADHEVRALGPCEVRHATAKESRTLAAQHPSLLAALLRIVMTEARLQRNWLVGLGRRTAQARMANLFCEIYARQEIVGLASGGHCAFPAVQADVADALGLSVVHTHRLLQSLKKMEAAQLQDGELTITNWARLASLGEFEPHLLRPVREAAKALAAISTTAGRQLTAGA